MESAISVNDVWKKFRLYHERNQSLKAAVMRGRRARYEEFDALKGVSFEIPEGTTFGLIGENGSGKSTLLKCMARILRPDRGDDPDATARSRRCSSSGAGFHPELSGRENVYLNGAILGMSKRQLEERFDEIVEFAGLEEFIDTPVKNYSSGMYVRLGFSVAINVDPDILLVDEVLAVGDEAVPAQVLGEVRRAQGERQDDRGRLPRARHDAHTVRPARAARARQPDRRSARRARSSTTYLGEVAPDRVADGEHGTRWGSGEGQIVDFELLDATGPTRDDRPYRRFRHLPVPVHDHSADREAGVRDGASTRSRACT